MIPPRVSVVVPVRNGMATLPALMDALRRQEAPFGLEVVAIDSGSTDGTPDYLRRHADRTLTIPPDSFDHGLTRNAGIAEARGEYVVLLVQDAIPASRSCLAALVAPFARDPRLAGTFARQQPREGASVIASRHLASWVAGRRTGRVVGLTREELDALPPLERLDRCAFDHVCAAIRRSVWLRHPYRPTPIAEDIEWAREVLCAGHRLAYVPDALVIHSHDRGARYEYRRTWLLHHRLYSLLGVHTVPTRVALLRAVASSVRTHLAWRRTSDAACDRGAYGCLRAISLGVAWPLGQYLGARAAARGRPIRRIPGV